MTSNDVGLIVLILTALALVGLAVPLLMGKGTGLIAGYNTMSAQEKARYNGPAMAKFTGKMVLAIGLSTFIYGFGLFRFGLEWITWAYLAEVIGLSVFAIVWCNTGNRFKK